MKDMLARNKGKLLLSSLVILLPIFPAALAGQTLFIWEPVLPCQPVGGYAGGFLRQP